VLSLFQAQHRERQAGVHRDKDPRPTATHHMAMAVMAAHRSVVAVEVAGSRVFGAPVMEATGGDGTCRHTHGAPATVGHGYRYTFSAMLGVIYSRSFTWTSHFPR